MQFVCRFLMHTVSGESLTNWVGAGGSIKDEIEI